MRLTASGSPIVVAVGGLVVGVAGDLSMGIGTYTSSRVQRQVHEGILKRIVSASRFVAHIFRERVTSYFTNRGYSKKLAEDVAEESSKDHNLLSRVIADEEYGLIEEGLVSPVQAALYAGIANLVGSFIPLIPYFFASHILSAWILSVVLAAVALAATGFFVALLAYMSPGKKVGEMILSGLGCAALTYFIGRGTSVLLGSSNQ